MDFTSLQSLEMINASSTSPSAPSAAAEGMRIGAVGLLSVEEGFMKRSGFSGRAKLSSACGGAFVSWVSVLRYGGERGERGERISYSVIFVVQSYAADCSYFLGGDGGK